MLLVLLDTTVRQRREKYWPRKVLAEKSTGIIITQQKVNEFWKNLVDF
jgi:hypothetical protein